VSFGIDSLRSGYSPEEGNRLIRRIDEAIRQSPIVEASAIARFALLTGGSWNDPMTILADKRFSTGRDDVNLNSVTPGFFRTLDEQVDRSLNSEHMLATLSSSFSTLALLLSLVGLYGVMSFVVTQRTREIGIRLALGATRWSAIWLVLRDALAMILAGIGIGLPFVWALGRLIESQLYEVKPSDPAAIAITI